jgi:hypothetical protein
MKTSSGKFIVEPERNISVLLDVDVVVVGGGVAGPFAAVASGRMGLKTVLVERFGALGGNLTIGLNSKPSGTLLGGIPLEFWKRLQKIGAAGTTYIAQLEGRGDIELCAPCDSELAKIELAKMCVEAGVTVLFEYIAAAPIMAGDTIKGVIVEGKGGRQAILSKVVIDCSADGDIAAQAGAPFQIGSETGDMQPVSLYFKVNGVDLKKFASWAKSHPKDVYERAISVDSPEYGIWATGFTDLLRQFQKDKNVKLVRECITLKTARGNSEMYCNNTRVLRSSGLNPLDISEAFLELYRQIELNIQFLNEYVPGFENSYINEISSILGVRETRHIHGGYILTGDNVMQGAAFEDSIALDTSAMDVHDVKGALVRFENFPPYEIPYRCLVPQKIEQLLVAGRCISTDHVAHGRTRNIPACMSTGQAAGFAAGLAVKTGKQVRDIDIIKVQTQLKKVGMPIRNKDEK